MKTYHPAIIAISLIAALFAALAQATPAQAELLPSNTIASLPSAASATASEVHAQLRPRRETVLSSELSAKIRHISVREGERFASGHELIRLDCALEEARLAKMKATLSGARKNAKVQQRLLDLNSTGALEVELAKVEVDKARADVRAQSVVLSKCAIQAPFSGRVVTVRARTHQFVQAGEPLVEILDDSAMEIDFIVPSHWLSWLQVGQGFSVTINETGESYPGTVLRLGARVDPVSQLVKVMGRIDGKFPALMSGMSGRVRIGPP